MGHQRVDLIHNMSWYTKTEGHCIRQKQTHLKSSNLAQSTKFNLLPPIAIRVNSGRVEIISVEALIGRSGDCTDCCRCSNT
jgi:hypothetical protein